MENSRTVLEIQERLAIIPWTEGSKYKIGILVFQLPATQRAVHCTL